MDVTVHLYDLSMGMARGMSMALLGRQVDYIPHTGIVVSGVEYFYGGGIQALPPHRVVEVFGLSPVERIPMGRTSKTVDDLRSFLRTVAHRYTQATYDLFRNNCNNFTNEVALFLVGAPIPDRILKVPEIVLSTPLGQSLGSMWSGMQQRMAESMGTTGGGAWDPFTGGRTVGGASFLAPAPAPTPAPVTAAAAPAAGVVSPSSVLPSHTAPLLALDVGNAGGLVARLIAVHEALPSDSPHRLNPDQRALLSGLPAALTDAEAGAAYPFPAVVEVVTTCARTWPHATAMFALLGLLRVLVLRPDCVSIMVGSGGVLWDVVEVVAGGGRGMYGNTATNVMALSTLANAFRTPAGTAWAAHMSVATKLIDAVSRVLTDERKEMRQLAAALAYNLANTLALGSDTVSATGDVAVGSTTAGDATVLVSDTSVQLLGSLLEGVAGEGDGETVKRRLVAAGRLLMREGASACELVHSLALDEGLVTLVDDTSRPSDLRALAAEVRGVIASGMAGAGGTVA